MNKEQLVCRLSKLFISRENVYVESTIKNTTKNGKVEAIYTTKSDNVKIENWRNHISGSAGLSLSPLLLNNKVYYGCVDVDNFTLDIKYLSIKYSNLPLFFCTSKSQGCHVFIFLKKQFPASEIRLVLDELVSLLKLPDKVEIFPKEDTAKPESKTHSIKMPYFNSDDTNEFCWYNGIKINLEQFIDLAENNLIDNIETLLSKFILSGAPPCLLSYYASGTDNFRHVFLYNVGVFLKQKYKTTWEDKLKDFNQDEFGDPLPDKDIEAMVKQVSKKEAYYQCKSELIGKCNKKLCSKKCFGLSAKNNPDILIGKLKKIATVPPIWEIEIEEKKIKLSTDQLMDQNSFRKACIEVLNKIPPKVKTAIWDRIIQERLDEVEIEEAPDDATEDNQLKNHIKQFCINMSNAREIDDISRGKVFKQDGMNLFNNDGLTNYLKRKQYNVKSNFLWDKIREMGGKEHRKNNKRFWSLPLFEEQSEIVESRKEVDWEAIKQEEDDKEEF